MTTPFHMWNYIHRIDFKTTIHFQDIGACHEQFTNGKEFEMRRFSLHYENGEAFRRLLDHVIRNNQQDSESNSKERNGIQGMNHQTHLERVYIKRIQMCHSVLWNVVCLDEL